jgi:hypothetical protein
MCSTGPKISAFTSADALHLEGLRRNQVLLLFYSCLRRFWTGATSTFADAQALEWR